MNDFIRLIVQGIFTVIMSLGVYAFYQWVRPWLQKNNLMIAAEIAVNAAEAMFGRYNGQRKFQLAVDKLKDMGFDIDSQLVIDAIKSAWQKLNIAQIAAGIKQNETEINENI